MEFAIRIQIEKLPEDVYVATSEDLPGLVVQGRTIAEALEMSRDVARKIIEVRREYDEEPTLPSAEGNQEFKVVIAA